MGILTDARAAIFRAATMSAGSTIVKNREELKSRLAEGEDGWLVVECPSILGCISQGKTQDEALDNIKGAIEGCLEVMEERVKAINGKQMVEVVV
jgi:predicted RNase H-like HicB family nuclease